MKEIKADKPKLTGCGNASAASYASNSVKLKRLVWKYRYMYLLLIPVVAYFLIFKYLPMYGIIIAFKDYKMSDGLLGGSWVGLKQFERLFTNAEFYMIFRNTLLLNLYGVVFYFPVPIFLAILLNEVGCTGFKRTIQSVLYVPHFISWVVLGGIIISLLAPSTGVVNSVISSLGFEPIFFLRSEWWWPVVYVASTIWQSAGWGTIIYLAAISSIDSEMYEAAAIDGANRFHKMVKITLPSISGTIGIMLILRMGYMLDVGFEHVYMLQNAAVRNVSEVISTYEYRIGLEGAQYSYTTALGLFKGFIGLILITSTNFFIKRISDGGGLW